ncbi:MAG: UDP-N-acetylmuramate--L-alanine ligase [Actinomycetota bacterium]
MTLPPGRVHFVGIGGAGMSAIAKVLLERGREVSGSDLKWSRAAAMLEAMGARVHVGHDPVLAHDAGAVVVSSAIPRSNPEYARALERDIPVMTRGEALAEILRDTRSIVVAGTHGKTTTTSMIVTILRHAGFDPTYLVGAGLNDSGTNARSGSGEVSVAEADESDGSFLLLQPSLAVLTNLEMDHVDHWGSFDELEKAFADFAASVTSDGAIVVPHSDEVLGRIAHSVDRTVVTFGEGGDVGANAVSFGPRGASFELVHGGSGAHVDLRVPGAHNVANAVAAAAAAIHVGVELVQVAAGLALYRGVERRFQVRGEVGGVTVIDDYAHHPTEVLATLEAARPGGWGRVVAIFQPHRYTRTAALADAFGASFGPADRVVLMDVYGAGEQPVPGVSGKLIADAVCRAFPGRPVAYFPHRSTLIDYLVASARPGDALLTLGAGDVTTIGDELLQRLGDRS